MIVLSGGLQKSGSAWIYQMTQEFLLARGNPSTASLRSQFAWHDILHHANCLLVRPNESNVRRLLSRKLKGVDFAVKVHVAPPAGKIDLWIRQKKIAATYIYRDPRAAALSAFDHGQKLIAAGKVEHPFAQIRTHRDALNSARRWLDNNWKRWIEIAGFVVRYEDLVEKPTTEMRRMVNYLGLNVNDELLTSIIESYNSLRGSAGKLHFNKGITDRFRREFSQSDLNYGRRLFADWLPLLGYEP